jgi:hypothetical protein
MHFEASHIAPVTPLHPRPQVKTDAAPAAPGRFAQVYDLTAERERRTPPPEALDAMAEAARVYDELDAAGLQVRFDLTRGVTAQLRDHDGALVRPLTLREVVDPSALLPPDAA